MILVISFPVSNHQNWSRWVNLPEVKPSQNVYTKQEHSSFEVAQITRDCFSMNELKKSTETYGKTQWRPTSRQQSSRW